MSERQAGIPIESQIPVAYLSAYVQQRKEPPYKPIDAGDLRKFCHSVDAAREIPEKDGRETDKDVAAALRQFYED